MSGSRRRAIVASGLVVVALLAVAAAALVNNDNARGHRSSASSGVAVRTRVANGQLIPGPTPIAPGHFTRPIAEYKAYAGRWAAQLGRDVSPLLAALADGDRARARRDWMTTFADYLHLGAVYGLLPTGLNDQLAGIPPTVTDDDFPGLHRIEKGLWTHESLRSLIPVTARFGRAVVVLRRVLSSVSISPLDYVTRTHEILEDAQRDLMSGTDVPWSGEGVLGTAASLHVSVKMVSTLAPLLDGRDDTLALTQYWLARLGKVLAALQRPNGTYPSLDQISQARTEDIDGTLAGTLGALAQVPASLETQIPSIPALPQATH